MRGLQRAGQGLAAGLAVEGGQRGALDRRAKTAQHLGGAFGPEGIFDRHRQEARLGRHSASRTRPGAIGTGRSRTSMKRPGAFIHSMAPGSASTAFAVRRKATAPRAACCSTPKTPMRRMKP